MILSGLRSTSLYSYLVQYLFLVFPTFNIANFLWQKKIEIEILFQEFKNSGLQVKILKYIRIL